MIFYYNTSGIIKESCGNLDILVLGTLIMVMSSISRRIFILLLLVSCLLQLFAGCSSAGEDDSTYAKARKHMIQTQLELRGIDDDQVLAAFDKVERHRFVPEKYQSLAYGDHPLPIGEDQTISQPFIVAVMTQLLEPGEDDRILEIGTGSGYQAAILAEIVKEVYSIEIIESLGRAADTLLKELGYENIHVRIGDGYKGWPEKAPFDGIIVTCAPPEIPQPLLDQLAESGRMIIPVGTNYQELILIEKEDGEISEKKILPVRFVPMTGEAQDKN